jgi:hypothetical protein
VTVTAVLAVILPVAASVPVTVMVYVPAVVPPVLPPPVVVVVLPDDPEPPPQPIHPTEERRMRAIASVLQRRRLGTPKKMTNASIVPGKPSLSMLFAAVVVGAVLLTVRLAVVALLPETVTEAGTSQVGALVGLAMLVVTAHERLTCPVNPPDGVMLTAEVLPLVAPGAIVMPLLLPRLKEAGNAVPLTVRLTFAAVDIFPVVPSTPVIVTT